MNIVRSAIVGLIEILLGSEVWVLKGKEGEIHVFVVRVARGGLHLQAGEFDTRKGTRVDDFR